MIFKSTKNDRVLEEPDAQKSLFHLQFVLHELFDVRRAQVCACVQNLSWLYLFLTHSFVPSFHNGKIHYVWLTKASLLKCCLRRITAVLTFLPSHIIYV